MVTRSKTRETYICFLQKSRPVNPHNSKTRKKLVIPRKNVYFQFVFFLISNQVAMGLNVKNGLKVKQLAKQLPTLKTLMQKTSAIGL